MARRPKIGYKVKRKMIKHASKDHTRENNRKKRKYVTSLLVFYNKKSRISYGERFVKFLIYISLRIAIKPSKWKNPRSNLKIIDDTYSRITSTEFTFIPAAIAFYLIMAFLPVISLITLIYSLGPVQDLFPDGQNPLINVLSIYVPGANVIIQGLVDFVAENNFSNTSTVFAVLTTIITTGWVASGGFAKMIYSMSHIYNFHLRGGYLGNRLKGMSIVFGITLVAAVGLTINIWIDHMITGWALSSGTETFVKFVTTSASLIVGAIVGFYLLFKFTPRFKLTFRHITPGVMVSAVPTSLFIVAYGFFINWFDYDQFGAMAFVMYLGIMSLFISIFTYIGILVNAAYYKTFIDRQLVPKKSIFGKMHKV